MMAAGSALAAPFAYVPNEQQQLNVIDLATNSVVTRITTESTTFGVAATNTNRVYVTDYATGTVQVIDSATNSTLVTLNICAQPTVPATNPAATRLLVACRRTAIDPGGVMVLDTATFNLQVINAAPDPLAATWSADGSRFYVTTIDHVFIFDAANYQVIASVPVVTGAFGVAVNSAGTKLYVASFGASGGPGPVINVIDLPTGRVDTVSLSSEPTWIALNPSGTMLFVAMQSANAVLVIGTASNAPLAIIQFEANTRPQSVAVHPDGSRIYIQLAGTGRLVSLDTQTFDSAVTIPYGTAGAAFGSFIGAGSRTRAAQAPGYLSGLWWNPSESGWGIQITKRRNNIMAAWFTYDEGGKAIWYVAPGCVLGTPVSCSGSLYRVADVRFFGGPYDFSLARIDIVGSLQLQFTGVSSGGMSYSVAGQSRFVPIERQHVGIGTTIPAVNYTDLWWNPAESGWGMTVTHQPGNMFIAWFVYDTERQPTWFVSSCNTAADGNSCSGSLLRVTGPRFSAPFDSSQVRSTTAGSVSLRFTDPDNGVLTYTVDGVDGTKNITREIF
jgi:DNA-binding beta-propeller fold protein YncE